MSLTPEFIENLLHEEESSLLDFKRAQYRFRLASNEDKSELLKDIIAFANAWRHAPAYILIGVREVKGSRSKVVGISEHIEDANVQEFVNKKTQRPITFSYTAQEFDGKQIGVITIPVQDRPFYLKQDFGTLKASTVYIRRGTSTDIASPDEIAKMGITGLKAGTVSREPALRVSFVDCAENVLERVKVPSYTGIQTEAEKESILDRLRDLSIKDEDIAIVNKRAEKLEEIFEYLPDGSEYRPFRASTVMNFKKEIDQSIAMANESFTHIEKRLGALNRVGLLDCEMNMLPHIQIAFRSEIKVSNDGTCPAENVYIYIDSTDSVKFFSVKELLAFDLTLEFPEPINETIRLAKLSDSQLSTIRLQYLRKRRSKFSFASPFRDIGSIRTMEDILNPTPTIGFDNGRFKIHFPKNLMHHHYRTFNSSSIFICVSLKKGQIAEVPYTCHANNLASPSKGILIFEGV